MFRLLNLSADLHQHQNIHQMKRKHIILIHIIFWVYIFNQSLSPLFINMVESNYFRDVFIDVALSIISFYSVYFLVPFMVRYRYKVVSVLTAVAMIIASIAVRTLFSLLIYKYIVQLPEKELVIDRVFFWYEVRSAVIIGIYAFLINFTISWFRNRKLEAELIMQKQASELALLRSQVNPHFLFNTLNNIYSLVYRKSDDAPEAIMKLSEIMRYMLYDANTEKVLLDKEITYLHSFIELQKLRLHDPDFVEFNVSGKTEGLTISPNLLISFVENAFKHGSRNVQEPGIIINLTAEPGKMCFTVSNFVRKEESIVKDSVGGIGLQNIRRRLELLYPGTHSLEIINSEEIFIVKLEIAN
jgi:two-component system, LytTR family, sensor kinase